MTHPPSIPHVPVTPLEIPAGTGVVLLVGGTFDPPHVAHARMAEAARDWLAPGSPPKSGGPPGLIHITFVPAARSPFKPPPVASDADRVDMLRAVAGDMGSASVWTDEIDRGRPGQASYWVDTLRRAHEAMATRPCASTPALPAARPELCFLLGADQAIALHRWREPRRILELARPVIVARAPITTPDLLARALRDAGFWGEGEVAYLVSRLAPWDLSDISATAIRAALAHASPLPERSLHPGVLRLIRQRRLYTR